MRINLDLDEQEYRRLEFEARRRGVTVDELARDLIRGSLLAGPMTSERIQDGLEALAWLREFRKTLPVAEVAPILEASRAELEERPHPSPKSSTGMS